ncbi:MAG: 50S ribosomal protein L3 N(5)-glutamine methyltransferase [Chromatiales bacterium]|jgi:ribosomal protein L3 glutamine methyltransferase
MESLQSISDFIRWGASRFSEAGLFFGHGTDNALDEAAALVLHALHLPPDLPTVWFNTSLTKEERLTVLAQLHRRIVDRVPVPYLTGEAWFAGLRFKVNPDVLIPRSPLAELVEKGFEPWIESEEVGHLLDLCCGSGCIGIAAAAYLPDCEVDLCDISEPALQVARENLEEHGLVNRVNVIRSDLFAAVAGKRYDVIVSNPPYVSSTEMAQLPREYDYEPVLALEADEDGLAVVVKILRQAGDYLTPGGILVIEVGRSAQALMDRYPDIPFLWLDFERGGEGVFVFTAEELKQFGALF